MVNKHDQGINDDPASLWQEGRNLGYGTMDMTDGVVTAMLGDCRQVTPVLSRLGDKWTVLVIVALRDGPCRFNEMKRNIDGISQQMLARTLKSLLRDGMLIRTTFATSPPQVQYALSTLGQSLSVPILALGIWVHDHLSQINDAQQAFDRQLAG